MLEVKMKGRLTYKDSGVDIDAGDRATAKIKRLAKSTFTPGVLKEIGSFGGFFSLSKREYKSPVLVSSVDSVGTKLKVAFMMGKHDTVGQDIVNHCVNDILVHGARPLFFLDYIGTGKLEPEVIAEIVKGLSQACRKAGCALIGGETAELPEFYQKGEYDLVGCVVGVVDRKKIIDGSGIRPGDQIIGIKSNGLHTNGYSLARNVFFRKARLNVNSRAKGLKTTVGKELLKVHRCYAPSILTLLQKSTVKGIAHITGGGIKGNLCRILPRDCDAMIRSDSWRIPPVFKVIQRLGNIDDREMFKVFNMGVGLILVVSRKNADKILKRLSSLKETAYLIGETKAGKGEVKLLNL
jgi:phosphoribosylformylglycinamidine cyclo-ligase